jgi:hypothetical protein
MAISSEDQIAFDALATRLRTMLPEPYQDCYDDVQPTSMGSAGLRYNTDGNKKGYSFYLSGVLELYRDSKDRSDGLVHAIQRMVLTEAKYLSGIEPPRKGQPRRFDHLWPPT